MTNQIICFPHTEPAALNIRVCIKIIGHELARWAYFRKGESSTSQVQREWAKMKANELLFSNKPFRKSNIVLSVDSTPSQVLQWCIWNIHTFLKESMHKISIELRRFTSTLLSFRLCFRPGNYIYISLNTHILKQIVIKAFHEQIKLKENQRNQNRKINWCNQT